MWKITPKLKQFAVETLSVAADAADEVFNAAIEKALDEEKVTWAKLKELTKADAEEATTKVKTLVEEAVGKRFDALDEKLAKLVGAKGGDGASEDAGAKAYQADLGGANVRVKSPLEDLDDRRTAATFDKSNREHIAKSMGGRSVTEFLSAESEVSYQLDMPTERSKTIAGVWFKNMVRKQFIAKGIPLPREYQASEREQNLLKAIAHECKFVGPVGWKGTEKYDSNSADYWCEGTKLESDLYRKAILDDTTSGGLEAVPIEFDAAVILTPLLTGELFPFVNITNVTRRRIEATKIGNPSMTWGPKSGTAISLFDTDGFISAFDNNIHPITGAMEVGLDFMADSPLAVGEIIINRYGLSFRKEMDDVIANGNGTTQPEGLFVAAGTNGLNSAGGANADPQVGDYEALMFGISKEFRTEPGARPVFLGTDTSYSRARGIPVGAADVRRVFGMNERSYTLFDWRYAINASAGNTKIGAFMLNRYRLYRRQGLEVRIITDDWQLARENKQGIVLRARFGGALELGGAGAVIDDAKA